MRALLWLSFLAACGEDNLTCEYLASEENCFKATASTALACLPPDGEVGVLSSDNATCTYATGQVVTFDPPLVLPVDFEAAWNFTVTTDGQPCLAYADNDEGFDLTVMGQTVSERVDGRGLELTCPDGSVFENGNALELLSCPGGTFGELPGNTSSSSDTSVTFGLLNAGTDTITVFDCSRGP